MSLVKGPFDIKWGDNTLSDIEELDVEYEVDTEDFETVQGVTYQIAGNHKVSATLTLLSNDVAALSAVLPQYFVDDGEIMSTGETVSVAEGAIDLVPGSCTSAVIYHNLDIIACGVTPQVFRMVNVKTEIDSVEFDGKLRKIGVKFIGESALDDATIQFFKQGGLVTVS